MAVSTIPGFKIWLLYILSTTLFASKANAIDVLAPNWNRTACIPIVTNLLSNGTSLPQDYFAVPPTSISNTTNYILTVPGCRALCGGPSHTEWYPDAGPRLITWLLPILLMVVNVPFPEVGSWRFATVAIVLGNPVQFAWGMILEVETWMAARRVAEQVLEKSPETLCLGRAIALYQKIWADPCVFEDRDSVLRLWRGRLALDGVEQRSERTAARDTVSQVHTGDTHKLLRELDRDMADFRRTDILRALLASIVYILLTLASFEPKLSEGSPGSGGKIAPAALLTFVLAIVGLGNAVGDFHLGGCEKVFRRYFASLGEQAPSGQLSRRRSPWPGGMLSYRDKFRVGKWPRMCVRFVLATLPLNIAFAASETIIATPPVYFSCRSKLVLGIYSLWLLSFFSNGVLARFDSERGKRLFRMVIAKDSAIAILHLVLICVASAGWGNTCECWGGVTGRVELNPASVFVFNNKKRYPIVVGVCCGLQVLVVGLVLAPSWRGYHMMWKEGIAEDETAHK